MRVLVNTHAVDTISELTIKETKDTLVTGENAGENEVEKISLPPVIPIKPFDKLLGQMVASVIIPYQETPENKYPNYALEYAAAFEIHPLYFTDSLLYAFTDKWNEIPYKKKKCNKRGINTFCFAYKYFEEVLGMQTEFEQLSDLNGRYLSPLKNEDSLLEGDVLFFGDKSEEGLAVKYIGIYLNGQYFLSVSPASKKVILASVSDEVYQAEFLGAARPLKNIVKK
jgi:hypothetical protein